MGLTYSNFFGGLCKMISSARVHCGRSRSSKADFGTNQKRIGDFRLVHHSNLDPILHHFGDIAGLCTHDPNPIPP